MAIRIGWKKAGFDKNRLVKLQILGEVVSPKGSNKRRCLRVRTLAVYYIESYYRMGYGMKYKTGKLIKNADVASSMFGGHGTSIYRTGKITRANGLDKSNNECGRGINFFWNKNTALRYNP